MPELKKMPTKEELSRGVENGDCMIVLDYPDFQIVAEYDSATYYYIDYESNEVCIVDAIASLVYDLSLTNAEFDSFKLSEMVSRLFDCDVCGHRKTSVNSVIYMWFKRRKEN